MKPILEIEDRIDERINNCIEDVEKYFLEYLDQRHPDSCPDISDLNYNSAVDDIIEYWTPNIIKNIEDIWYLHKDRLIEAYVNAGIAGNPRENNGMAAINLFLTNEVYKWYRDHAVDIYQEWVRERFNG